MACTGNTYTLDGTNLSVFGFRPKSPVALTGMWDMPARIGKTSHNWQDENYLEPYVRADEIFFGGRDLVLSGYIPYSSATDLGDNYYSLNLFLDGFTSAVSLHNGSLGTFIVTVQSFNVVELCPTGYAEISISFRESEVVLWGSEPVAASGGKGIAGYSWADFGAYTISPALSGYSRGESKILPSSVYGQEVRRVRTRNGVEVRMSVMVRGASLSVVAGHIGGLARVLAAQGKKILQLQDGLIREVFVQGGFRASIVRYTSSRVSVRVDLSFTEIYTAKEMAILSDVDDIMANSWNEQIAYIIN